MIMLHMLYITLEQNRRKNCVPHTTLRITDWEPQTHRNRQQLALPLSVLHMKYSHMKSIKQIPNA
jgi:hypothetical protein